MSLVDTPSCPSGPRTEASPASSSWRRKSARAVDAGLAGASVVGVGAAVSEVADVSAVDGSEVGDGTVRSACTLAISSPSRCPMAACTWSGCDC